MLLENISLSAKERLEKSTRLADLLNDSESHPLKGYIDGNTCSGCNNSAIHYTATVGCGKCHRLFHILCIPDQISGECAASIRINPSLWWVCLHCINECEHNHSQSQTPPTSMDSTIESCITKKLHEALGSFRTDILSAIDSKLNKGMGHSIVLNQKGIKRKADGVPAAAMSKMPRMLEVDTNVNDRDAAVIEDTSTQSYAAAVHNTPIQVSNQPNTFPLINQNKFPNKSNQKQKKFTLHYRPVIDKKMILNTEEWYQLRRVISETLNSIKVSFSHFNSKTGRFVIGFPNELSKKTAYESLKSLADLWCFEVYVPEKMLPKLTVHNVPVDFQVNNDSTDSDHSGITQRDLVKDQIWKTVMDKNEGVKSLVESGSVLEIVYFRKHTYTATVALKVSPELRLHILDNCDGRLFLFSGSCRVSDRCHYQQCFHCLKFGHIHKNCPKANDQPTCRYCADSHDSRTCTFRSSPNNYKCHNCINSKSPLHQTAHNHSACSKECPTALSIVNRIHENTQFDIIQKGSKNP